MYYDLPGDCGNESNEYETIDAAKNQRDCVITNSVALEEKESFTQCDAYGIHTNHGITNADEIYDDVIQGQGEHGIRDTDLSYEDIKERELNK